MEHTIQLREHFCGEVDRGTTREKIELCAGQVITGKIRPFIQHTKDDIIEMAAIECFMGRFNMPYAYFDFK